jgi:hypothetical protein
MAGNYGSFALLLTAFLNLTLAAPTPVDPPHPMITPPPTLVDRAPTRVQHRDVLSDIDSYVGGVLSELGSAIPSYVASGVPEYFVNLPTGTAVMSTLGISSSDLAAVPTAVLNLP